MPPILEETPHIPTPADRTLVGKISAPYTKTQANVQVIANFPNSHNVRINGIRSVPDAEKSFRKINIIKQGRLPRQGGRGLCLRSDRPGVRFTRDLVFLAKESFEFSSPNNVFLLRQSRGRFLKVERISSKPSRAVRIGLSRGTPPETLGPPGGP